MTDPISVRLEALAKSVWYLSRATACIHDEHYEAMSVIVGALNRAQEDIGSLESCYREKPPVDLCSVPTVLTPKAQP